MRKGKLIKGLYYTLIGSLILGNISPVLAKTSIASVDETIDIKESGSSETSVYAELGSEFLVTIPKSITLSGLSKTGIYTVSVEGDIAGYEKINVIPDETFTLNSSGLAGITANINQDKTSWTYGEILTDSKIIGNGLIEASNLTAGKWNGAFNFNINLKGSGITVEAKDENGNDLNASASEITGTEKETLLNSLVEIGMINSKDEVNALIEVESDKFDGMADTTFNVSSIANEGDKVAILHFDETKQEWEYIGTETVDSNGLISGDFTSYSPVAFVKITENNQMENIEYVPFTLTMDNYTQAGVKRTGNVIIPKTFEYNNKKYIITGIGNCAFYNQPNLTSVTIPDSVTSITGSAFSHCTGLSYLKIPDSVTTIGTDVFYGCTGLTNIEISNNITSIGQNAFYASGLKNITLPQKITKIEKSTFHICKSLESVTIPSNVTSIGQMAFYGCFALKTINYEGTEEEWKKISKGSEWSSYCPSDMKIVYNYTE